MKNIFEFEDPCVKDEIKLVHCTIVLAIVLLLHDLLSTPAIHLSSPCVLPKSLNTQCPIYPVVLPYPAILSFLLSSRQQSVRTIFIQRPQTPIPLSPPRSSILLLSPDCVPVILIIQLFLAHKPLVSLLFCLLHLRRFLRGIVSLNIRISSSPCVSPRVKNVQG